MPLTIPSILYRRWPMLRRMFEYNILTASVEHGWHGVQEAACKNVQKIWVISYRKFSLARFDQTTKMAAPTAAKCELLTEENIKEFVDSFDTILTDCDGNIFMLISIII